jgi:V8-like Glu-specific endopeptidase
MTINPSTYPYDTIVRITDTINGQGYQGSGVLISPDEVLTASHVVYIDGQGSATNIVVTPGYNDGTSPYGSVAGTTFHYFDIDDLNRVITNQQSQFDYAVIHLATPFSSAGTMGISANFGGGTVDVSGYPASASGAQVDSVQTVTKDPTYTLLDGTAIGEGSSGGPVWGENSSGQPFVVGIISAEADAGTTGYYVQLTTADLNQIETWVAQDDNTAPPAAPGLIGDLTVNQQLELIYIAYFDRAADGPGFNFWEGQNVQAQNTGESAATALSAIAASFAPQAETIALYPFLGSAGANLSTPSAQAGLTTLIAAVYENLFGHAPDSAGAAYWLGQISSGAVGVGPAILAIANGATGTDATTAQNKISVALDFTTRTSAAGLSTSGSASATFLAEARSVLSGVNGISLGDASVTNAENATTAFINSSKAGAAAANGAGASLPAAGGPITISASYNVTDPGAGNASIQFLAGTSRDTLVLHAGSVDQVSGFDPGTDILDVRSLLSEAGVNLNGDIAALSNYLTVTDVGSDALLNFDPSGQGGGSTAVVLQGLGSAVTGLNTLIAHGAIQAV